MGEASPESMSEETSGRDRITEVRIQGMRALADVRLPLGGLTVLIGENGSGKSTIVEALDLLRQAGQPGSFVNDSLGPWHDGLEALLRAGATSLHMGVRIEGGGPRLDYTFALAQRGSGAIISEERLLEWQEGDVARPAPIIDRDATSCRFLDRAEGKIADLHPKAGELALQAVLRTQGSATQPAAERVRRVFDAGRAHVRFHLRPRWVQEQRAPMRYPADVRAATELDRLGGNLANCYHALSNSSDRAVWERTLERLRAGLDVERVITPAVGHSQIDLAVVFHGLPKPIPALALSDGQLAYLAFVALAELGKDHGFIAFDEPESHLHPELLVRVVWLLEELAASCPVILSTQSDRLLDALAAPAKSVILCELDEARATRLYRPEPAALKRWLERYRGLGDLRAEGYAPQVFREPVENGA